MKIVRILVAAVLALALAAPTWAAEAEKGPRTQQVVIRVLDADGMPLEGAEVAIEPVAGAPDKPGPYRSDIDGEVVLQWLPDSRRVQPTENTEDQLTTMRTGLRYTVTAPGYLSSQGSIDETSSSRRVADEEVMGLSRQARLEPIVEDVQLRAQDTILPPEIKRLPVGDPLRSGLQRFFDRHQLVAPLLGCEFASPVFGLNGGRLSVIVLWRRTAWVGLNGVPLHGAVLVSAGLPLLVAIGEDLASLPGVGEVALVIMDEAAPKGDPHAMPRTRRMVIEAPAADFRALAAGVTSADAFLTAHRPSVHLQ